MPTAARFALQVSHLKKQIPALGWGGRLEILEPVLSEAKKGLFECSDVAPVPSSTENFGIVVAEALAHGVPVIASKGTPWSRLEDMRCGVSVDNDPESLAGAIRNISMMPPQDMGLQGTRMDAETNFPGVP